MATPADAAQPAAGDTGLSAWVDARREALRQEADAGADLPQPPAPGDPLWGLAFSGGGIRSATFCLGVATGLARNRIFHRFDLLSTVSGGGYIGAALGKLFNEKDAQAADIQRGLGEPGNTWFIWWLRATSRYLTPRGAKDLLWAMASYGRSMLAVHLELALALMMLGATLGLVDLLSWKGLYAWFAHHPDQIASVGGLLKPWVSTLWLYMLLPLLAGIPLMAAYWSIPSQRGAHSTGRELLLTAIRLGLAALLAWLAVRDELVLGPLHDGSLRVFCGAVAFLLVLVAAGPVLAWLAKPPREAQAGQAQDTDPALGARLRRMVQGLLSPTADTGAQAQQRNRLTQWLSWCLFAALVLLVLGALDRLAWLLAFERQKYTMYLPLAIALGLAVTRALASRLPAHDPATAVSGRLLFKLAEFSGLILLGLLALFWVALVYRVAMVNLFAPAPLDQLEFRSAGLLVLSFLGVPLVLMLLTGRNADFANLSSLHMFYRARLGRSYLGAANRKRFQVEQPGGGGPQDADPLSAADVRALVDAARRPSVFEVDPGDTVGMEGYRPQARGGPVHIMNVTVNQTHDPLGGLFNQDRKGQYLSVTSQGYYRVGLDRWRSGAAWSAAQLPAWMAISGAAFAPGLGGQTSTGMALLLFMAGVRLGYWWESDAPVRGWRAHLPPPKYRLLYGEAFASFGGIGDRFWYLSDGGHFENTAAYSLLREGARMIVAVDAAADPTYIYGDLENLVRKARIDLQVEVEFVDVDASGVERLALFGSLDQLRDPASSACIALARVKYPAGPPGWLVYVKPNIFGGLPIDLINYKREHPAFPQEPTTDQFFSESQWESYFRLGRALGLQLEGGLLRDLAAHDPAIVSRLTASRVQPGQPPAADAVAKALPFTVRYPRAVSLAKSGLSLTALLAVLAAASDTWDRFAKDRNERRKDYAAQLRDIAQLHERMVAGRATALPDLTAKLAAFTTAYCSSEDNLRPTDATTAGIYADVVARCESRRDDPQSDLTPVCKTLATEKARRCFAGGQRLGQPVYWAVAYDDSDWARDRIRPARQPVLAAPGPRPAPAPAPTTKPMPPAAGPSGEPSRGPASTPAPAPAPAPAPVPAPGTACTGKLVYLQVYDNPERAQASAWGDWLASQGARIKEVEDVVATATREGRAAPRPVRQPTVVYHSEQERACAQAMQERDATLAIRQLARGLVPSRNVIEVWLPPEGGVAQKKY